MSQTRITLPILLEHHESPATTELANRHEYFRERKPAQYRMVRSAHNPRGPFDPWQLRADFLNWPLEYWEGFIEMAGNFGTCRISEEDFAEWQALIRHALVQPPSKWRKLEAKFDPRKVRELSKPLPISFGWDEDVPSARITLSGTLQTIIATIQIELLQGAQFRVCARPDCHSAPFKLESHQKIYCSPECAHLAAVRASRKRQAARKSNTKQERRK